MPYRKIIVSSKYVESKQFGQKECQVVHKLKNNVYNLAEMWKRYVSY
jgi:hypothetical protein